MGMKKNHLTRKINYFLGNNQLIQIINYILNNKNIEEYFLYKMIEESLEIIARKKYTRNVFIKAQINKFSGNIFFFRELIVTNKKQITINNINIIEAKKEKTNSL